MKKIFGNIPAVPLIIFIIIAVVGIAFSFYHVGITGYPFFDTCPSAGGGRHCAASCNSSEVNDSSNNCANIGDICCMPACTRVTPNFTIAPASQPGTAGQTLNYTVTVKNNDPDPCISSNFTLGIGLWSCPSGFTCTFDTDSSSKNLTINTGASASTTLSVKSGDSTAPGDYTVTVLISRPGIMWSVVVHANYSVIDACHVAGGSCRDVCNPLREVANTSYICGGLQKCCMLKTNCSNDAECSFFVGCIYTGKNISKCNNVTQKCYCGGVCGDGVCDNYENMSGKCTSDCGSVNATVTLISPKDKNSTVPGDITFKWTPKNFANVNVSCFPYVWLNGTTPASYDDLIAYPSDETGNAVYIDCKNNTVCNWTTTLSDENVYLWQVGCYDPIANVTASSEERLLEITPPVAGLGGCVSNWINITDWVPVVCPETSVQAKFWREVNSCVNITAMPQDCNLTKTNVPYECAQTKDCPYYPSGEEIPTVIANWSPYPCTGQQIQTRVSNYSNGTILTETRTCRTENWTMTCVNGTQVWEDQNNAGTEYTKPVAGTCEERPLLQQLMPWIWIAVAAIAIVLIIIFVMKGISTRRAGKILSKKPEVKPKPEAKEEHPELKDFIAKAVARGMTKEKIRTELLKAGWPEDVVEAF